MDTNATPEMIPKVSVVIPVYNVERYLDKCVQSVLHQTLTDIEIILADDGSPDRCGEMCDEYARQDSRVRVVHKSNGGLSDARNAGIRIARADYVGFVDSDDYIDDDMYEILYAAITKEHADIACCGTMDVFKDLIRPGYRDTKSYFVTDREEAMKLVLERINASLTPCNKLYKREILLDNLFPTECTHGEDAQFVVSYLDKITKAVFHLLPKYYYVHHMGSISTSGYREGDSSIFAAYESNRTLIKRKYPALIDLADFNYYQALFAVFEKILVTEATSKTQNLRTEKQSVKKEIRDSYFQIIKNRHIGKGRKIAVTGLMVHEALYKLCLNAYEKRRPQRLR